jgi:hypothetical protein
MTARLIDTYLGGVDVRRTVRNWPEDVRAIVDGYCSYTSISHAVQKDAVQNGWSARKNRKGKDWTFTFELIESGEKKFLLMTDSGTTGLTGRILKPEEYEIEQPAEERWGRFEGVAFTQPRAERTLGSRGRGKFIFVGASKDYTILYDTLREDRSYRFGFRTVVKTESPIAAYDGEEGRKKIIEITSNLITPLNDVGTRVIIVNPVDELLEDLKNGNLLRHIGETWWEIIVKYGATIRVRTATKEEVATAPKELRLLEEDSGKLKVRIRKHQRIPIGIQEAKIKTLHMVYEGGRIVPHDIRGISIQRDGMKICSIQPTYLGREIAERIYGYINFDDETEEIMLEAEGPEHYSYDFRRSFPGAIKRYVEDELLKFAQEKLGYGLDQRELKRQQQRNAERRALTAVNSFSRELGIGAGPGGKHNGSGGARTPRKIRIQLDELELPRKGDLRVNYEETLKNIRMRVVNDDSRSVEVRVKFFLRYYDKLVKPFFEGDLTILGKTASTDFGPFQEKFTKDRYPSAGKYTIVARILSLMDEDKGIELDYKTKSFYLEEDPPMRGLFERCEAFGFPDDEPLKYWMGYSEYGSERGLILYYNLNHPGYGTVSETEEDLAEYIIRIAGQEICRFDLMQEQPILFKDSQLNDPQEVLKVERNIVGELVYRFRKGEL